MHTDNSSRGFVLKSGKEIAQELTREKAARNMIEVRLF